MRSDAPLTKSKRLWPTADPRSIRLDRRVLPAIGRLSNFVAGRIVTPLMLMAWLVTAPAAWPADVFLGRPQTDASPPLSAFRHDAWTGLLNRYVDDIGGVDYRRWHDDGTEELDDYLDRLSIVRADDDATANDRMAFWINAYNAITIRGILREYPTDSIRNHTAKFFGYNIWEDLRLRVSDTWTLDGSAPSLDEIEHQILRPMGDFRIHFAIVCAARGCPWLRREAYEADTLDRQLNVAGKSFFARPENFSIDDTTLQLSPILKWFAEDFGDTERQRLRSIAAFLSDDQRGKLKPTSDVRYSTYDWSLNESRSP